MHIHILGICGTFMAGVAVLARELGYKVTGSDSGVYPPMSEVLAEAGIVSYEGYDPGQLLPAPDLVVIGNALSRGNPAVEQVLASGLPYVSGPEWIAREVLAGRWVIAIAGTHGKTTTTSLVTHMLTAAGLEPGFLVGGMVPGLRASARLGKSPYFVIEADEYDTAFFDKRSKFVHYRPTTLVLGNLEFDHADIFPDLAAIETQFHHLIRTVPRNGRIIHRAGDPALGRVIDRGLWSQSASFGTTAEADYAIAGTDPGWREFEVSAPGQDAVAVASPLVGRFNAENVTAALAAVHHAGVPLAEAADSVRHFSGVRRRLERVYDRGGIVVYDDFAHHPTAITETLTGLRAALEAGRIIAIVEPRSNSMRMGAHRDALPGALASADVAHLYVPATLPWSVPDTPETGRLAVHSDTEALIATVAGAARPGDHIVVMSNGSFGGLPDRLGAALDAAAAGRGIPS